MTALWIAAAVLTVAAVALLLRPLFAHKGAAAARLGYDLAVFQDQLREVDRDVEAGLLTAEQAEAARTEINRRMLAAAAHDRVEAAVPMTGGRGRPLALAATVAVAVPAGALGFYVLLGSPSMPDRPYAEVQEARMGLNHEGAENIKAMVERLAERLKINPDDAEGWAMLGKSHRALGRLDEAERALRRSAELGGGSVDLWGTLGEVIVAQGQGMVMPDAREAFLSALRVDARDPRARFYLGLARMQIGDAPGAVAVWRDLEQDSAPDAPWMTVLRQHIRDVSAEAGFEPSSVAPKSELQLAGTASPGGAAIAQAPHPGASGAEGQEEFVRQRVTDLADRLAKNPNDADGWTMLGRSYKTMGEAAKSRDAYGRAAKLKPRDIALQMAYAEAILNTAPDDGKLPAEFVTVMRGVLVVDAAHADALYYVGLAEAEAGRPAKARDHWGKLLASLDPNSPEHAELSREVDKLKGR